MNQGPQVLRLAVGSDEPQATMVGREVLARGGNAADAAVAMALTMAVRLPSRAGIGGGGTCLAFDPETGRVRSLDFLPPPMPPAGEGGRPPAAIPTMLRGLFALHAEYGSIRWEQLMVAAENAARFGGPVSRALGRDLAASGAAILADPTAAAVLARPDGSLIGEGEVLRQPELAAFLGRVRQSGIGALYGGTMGRDYAAAVEAAGYALSAEAIRTYGPVWSDPVTVAFGDDEVSFSAAPGAGGAADAAAFAALAGELGYARAAEAARPGLIASALARAGAAEGSGAATGASLAAMSEDGSAVTCALTMNGAFGTGRTAPGTGIFIAPAAPAGSEGLAGVAMWSNQPTASFIMAGAAADTRAALLVPLAEMLLAERPVADALAAPRGGSDGGRSTFILCRRDRSRGVAVGCEAGVDPRGAGLADQLEL
jgi:gamma-glutamyltranspeptidase/glutathione hydrolase